MTQESDQNGAGQKTSQGLVLALGAAMALAIAYVHALSGLAYEFHGFFIVPVLLAAWFAGARAGYAMTVLVTLLWLGADSTLEGEQAAPLPLLFNTVMRLALFTLAAGLAAQLKGALERESRLAREDALTGLPNRREFLEQGRRALAHCSRQQTPLTAVFIDLDRFKEVNDRLGHEAGDELLATVAAGLRDHLRASDIAGRLGGDEFALLLPGTDESAAARYAENLRERLSLAMQTRRWPVSFSIGLAARTAETEDLESLLARADARMYAAKRRRKAGAPVATAADDQPSTEP